MDKKILETIKKEKYILRRELVQLDPLDPEVEVLSAYTLKDGAYIGTSDDASFLCDLMGIVPEIRDGVRGDPKTANGGKGFTCSIGFCEGEQKWYGWSHRHMTSFGVGDTYEKVTAKNLADAKKLATKFADNVS